MVRNLRKISLAILCFFLLFHGLVTPATAAAEQLLKIGGVGSSLDTMKLLAAAFGNNTRGWNAEFYLALAPAA